MKIMFHSNQLGERGTETALIDYAYANKNILKNESILCFPENKILDKNRFDLLKKDFKIYIYPNIEDLKKYIIQNKIELLYIITDGYQHDIADEITETKTFVHAVFSTKRKHGTYYCPIHSYLNHYFNTKYPVLPHIIKRLPNPNDNLRIKLNIPEEAIIFGSYAGPDRFNIKFVRETIIEIAKKRKNIYFIFMNINDFIKQENNKPLENIIFLPGTTDNQFKSNFINICDAMIHARDDGETFGLSIAEFASFHKPIITYKPNFFYNLYKQFKAKLNNTLGYSKAHIINLGKSGIYYSNKNNLKHILLNFNKYTNKNDDCFVNKFNEKKIIEIFNNIINE